MTEASACMDDVIAFRVPWNELFTKSTNFFHVHREYVVITATPTGTTDNVKWVHYVKSRIVRIATATCTDTADNVKWVHYVKSCIVRFAARFERNAKVTWMDNSVSLCISSGKGEPTVP